MKSHTGNLAMALMFVAILSGGPMGGTLDVWAQEKGGSIAQQLQGSWSLVSIYNELDGKKTDQFGLNPRGSLIFTPDGRFSLIIMRVALPKFASNNRVKGTAEENQAVVQGSVAYFGTYKVVNEKDRIVGLHFEGSTFPNWDDQDQTRIINIVGDEMRSTNPTATIGGTNFSVWKRIK